MNCKKVLGSIVGVLAVTLTLAGCGSNSAKQQVSRDYKYGSITIPAKDGSVCNARPTTSLMKRGSLRRMA